MDRKLRPHLTEYKARNYFKARFVVEDINNKVLLSCDFRSTAERFLQTSQRADHLDEITGDQRIRRITKGQINHAKV